LVDGDTGIKIEYKRKDSENMENRMKRLEEEELRLKKKKNRKGGNQVDEVVYGNEAYHLNSHQL
jgi:hypothetical protein